MKSADSDSDPPTLPGGIQSQSEVPPNDANQRTMERLTRRFDTDSSALTTTLLTFLLVATLLAITVGATTDEMLLLGATIELPLLKVGLPLVGFYVIAPFFFFLLHFYLLLQYNLLSRNVVSLRKIEGALPGHPTEGMRVALTFVNWTPDSEHDVAIFALLKIGSWSIAVLFPLVLLLFVQVRFLPYHNAGITWWHRALVISDLALTWSLWPKVLCTRASSRRLPWSIMIAATGGLAFAAFCLLAASVPGEPVDLLPDGWKLPRRSLEIEGLDTANRGTRENATEGMANQRRAATAPFLPINLQARDLRYAHLQNCRLHGAWLRGADMRGASLNGVDLTEADLTIATPPIASAASAVFNIVGEWRAGWPQECGEGDHPTNLDGAKLVNVTLRGADLRCVRMRHAFLDGVDLRGANMGAGHFENTSIWNSDLRGVILRESLLQIAWLNRCRLEGADLYGANLRGTHFIRCDMTAVDLHTAKTGDSSFEKTTLAMTNLADLDDSPMDDAEWKNIECEIGPILNMLGAKETPPERPKQVLPVTPAPTPGPKPNAVVARLSEKEREQATKVWLEGEVPNGSDYDRLVNEYVVWLCRDTWIARSIADRAIRHHDPTLASALLDSGQMSALPPDVGWSLRETAHPFESTINSSAPISTQKK